MTDKKSKTAMQELIEVLESYFGKDHFKAINFQSKLDKEREQIVKAVNTMGYDGENYFRQVYEP